MQIAPSCSTLLQKARGWVLEAGQNRRAWVRSWTFPDPDWIQTDKFGFLWRIVRITFTENNLEANWKRIPVSLYEGQLISRCNQQILAVVSLPANNYTALRASCRPEDLPTEQPWTALALLQCDASASLSILPATCNLQEKCKLQTCKQLLGEGEEASCNRIGCQIHRCHVCCVMLVISSESLRGSPLMVLWSAVTAWEHL